MGAAATTECDDSWRPSTPGSSSRVTASAAARGQVQVATTEILRIAGLSAYHTSVILGDKEYYFDSQGIIAAPAMWSHLASKARRPADFNTEVLSFGTSALDAKSLVENISQFFQKGTYDVLCKNCNSFTDSAIYFLTGARLDGRYSRLERFLAATRPVSTTTINQLIQWARQGAETVDAQSGEEYNDTESKTWGRLYSTNPRAEDFNVEDVVAACDGFHNAEDAASPDNSGPCATCGIAPGWCGRQGRRRAKLFDGLDSPSISARLDAARRRRDEAAKLGLRAVEAASVLDLDGEVDADPEVADEASAACRPPSRRKDPVGDEAVSEIVDKICTETECDAGNAIGNELNDDLNSCFAEPCRRVAVPQPRMLGQPIMCSDDVQYL